MYSKISSDRTQVLEALLVPIIWLPSSSIRVRQNIVIERHKKVRLIYPFLTAVERLKVDEWFKKESHSDLWE